MIIHPASIDLSLPFSSYASEDRPIYLGVHFPINRPINGLSFSFPLLQWDSWLIPPSFFFNGGTYHLFCLLNLFQVRAIKSLIPLVLCLSLSCEESSQSPYSFHFLQRDVPCISLFFLAIHSLHNLFVSTDLW